MTTSLLQAITVSEETLADKLEFAILSVLIHYNGRIEESLVEWYSALRLGHPQLTDPRQLEDVFKSLSASGIIELDAPATGPFQPFLTILTPAGLVHWNTVGVQPRQSSAF